MKKILFLFIAILISISASADKWYVATTGDDGTGDGSLGNPYKTLYKALSVAVATDTIMVGAGTFTETQTPLIVPVQVNIQGVGVTSIIKSADTDPILYLTSGVEGTNGNQFITDLAFNGVTGTDTSIVAIYVTCRSNVHIYDCKFDNFKQGAVRFKGAYANNVPPDTYATGNKFYNNYLTDCSKFVRYPSRNGYGALAIGGQDGFLAYNDTIINTGHETGKNGYLIKYLDNGHNKNAKIYNNYLETVPEDYGLAIAIEMWNGEGGNEIYNNTILGGCINVAGSYAKPGASYFSFDIHHNTLGLSAIGSQSTYVVGGVAIEGAATDVYVHHNMIKNAGYGLSIAVALVRTAQRIYFDYNIVHNWGTTAYKTLGAVGLVTRNTGSTMSDVYFRNNVFYNDGTNDPRYVVFFNPREGNFNNVNFMNNICIGGGTGFYWMTGVPESQTGPITIDQLNILNNIIYGNGYNTYNFNANITVTNAVETGSINSDPQWIGGSPYSFKIPGGSPARNAGLSIEESKGLTEDYYGGDVPIGSLPDIGAFEFGSDVNPPDWTEQGIGWDRVYKKVNHRDTVNFSRGFMISGVPISASGSGLEILGGLEASVDDLNATQGATDNFQGQINDLVSADTAFADKANIQLDNLASVAINTHLLPGTDGAVNLGSATYKWGNIFLDSAKVVNWNNGDITITHSDQKLTMAGGTLDLPSGVHRMGTDTIASKADARAGGGGDVSALEARVDSIVTVLADTANIETLLQVDLDTDTLSTKAYARSLTGVSITDVRNEIADSLNVLRPTVKFNVDTVGIFVFGAGSGAAADSLLFEKGDKNYGTFYNYTDTLYVVNFNVLYLTSGDSLRFNCYWGNRMTETKTDSLFTSPQAVGVNQNILTPNDRKIPPDKDVWIEMSGTQLTGLRPKQFEIQLNGYIIRDH